MILTAFALFLMASLGTPVAWAQQQSVPPPPGAGSPAPPPPAPPQTASERALAAIAARAAKKAAPTALFPLDVAWRQKLASAPSVPPAYDEGAVYVPLKTGALLSFSLADGVQRWSLDGVPVTSAPTVDSGRLYLAGDGTIGARDAATGKPIWEAPSGGVLTAPLLARGGWLIVALDNGDVRALRGDTGEQVWQLALGAVVKTDPLIVGDRLYLSPLGSLLMALDLVTGKTIWERDLGSMVTSVAAQGDRIVLGTSGRKFIALDEKRGEVKWQWRIGGEVIGKPAFDDETVYMISMANDMRAFAVKDGSQRWREAMDYRPLAGPIRIGGVLLVPSISPMLRGYNPKDGKRSGQYALPIAERASPAAPPQFIARPTFIDDLIVTATADGDLIALRRRTAPPIMPFEPIGTAAPALSLPTPAPPSTSAAATAKPPLPL